MIIDQALEAYRYGEFGYKAPDGTSIIFLPSRNPNKNYGELKINIRFYDCSDIPMDKIKPVLSMLEKIA